MTVYELYEALSKEIPQELSMPWDNDGLQLCPDPQREVKKVLCALDLTYEAAKLAVENGCDAVMTHHPFMFAPVRSVRLGEGKGDALLLLAKNGISAMSFHTRYDALDGGMNDMLCRALGLEIGERFGDKGEEIGRLSEIPETDIREFAARVKKALGAPVALLSAGEKNTVKKIALCGGDGKDFIIPAARCGADILITGRASYNTAVEAQEHGIALLECGHFYTEVICLPDFAARLREKGVEAVIYDKCEIEAV
ncbi:MAG: Nif3-like dinuclear metal center hexameric protein [Ruminococcaceae bacterium]|nr:Nif3-like dinuclear metal center hexameric protein [Oscillospiraceae bacterium]